tara:strand:+ start:11956 stop:12495 length:540 start_codon:yes stop_codon:yes gene_type:complete
MPDLEFIARTIHTMTEGVQNKETLHKIMGTANEYAKTMKFPKSKTEWSDEQLDKYFNMIERLVELPVQYSQADFDELTLEERLEAAGLAATDKTEGLQQPGGLVGEVLKDMEQQNKYRDDLKCPYCQAMVYDNRNSKKSDKSPDFTCSTNDPVVCGGHTGKWRKSWWLDNTDIPEEWGI